MPVDLGDIVQLASEYAKQHLSREQVEEYEQACGAIADHLEQQPANSRAPDFAKRICESFELYQAGLKYAIDKEDITACIKLGKALQTFESACLEDNNQAEASKDQTC